MNQWEYVTCFKFFKLYPNDLSFLFSAVPLSVLHPNELLEYFLTDCQADLIIATPSCESKVKPLADKLNKPIITMEHSQFINKELDKSISVLDKKYENVLEINEKLVFEGIPDGDFYNNASAMILYTSGTTSRPKGVLFTHKSLTNQINSLTNAWNISNTDTILHTLPLHHVHGVVNALMLPLYLGGKCIMLPRFASDNVWSYLLNVNMPIKDRVTLFMAVPTMYNFLIQEYDKLFSKKAQMSEYIKSHCQQKIRLMISGSAPLPSTTFQRWKDITGHKLLERYGMSEIGMALSNPLKEDQLRQRIPLYIGQPLPGVSARIARPENLKETLFETHGEADKGFWSKQELPVYESDKKTDNSEIMGTLLIKSPNIFKEYWNRPDAMEKSFVDGWFITGDSVSYDPVKNSFKILGRNNVDIIKTGGYKVSALEIETKILENPLVADVAVVGIPDQVWGQRVIALISFKDPPKEEDVSERQTHENLLKDQLRKFCVSKLAEYSVPSAFRIVDKIPRNQMGKVNKTDLVSSLIKEIQE